MKREIIDKKIKQAEKLQQENMNLIKLKMHENEVRRQRVKDNFKTIQRNENKKRNEVLKAQRQAMINQSKRFFKTEAERKAQLKK